MGVLSVLPWPRKKKIVLRVEVGNTRQARATGFAISAAVEVAATVVNAAMAVQMPAMVKVIARGAQMSEMVANSTTMVAVAAMACQAAQPAPHGAQTDLQCAHSYWSYMYGMSSLVGKIRSYHSALV